MLHSSTVIPVQTGRYPKPPIIRSNVYRAFPDLAKGIADFGHWQSASSVSYTWTLNGGTSISPNYGLSISSATYGAEIPSYSDFIARLAGAFTLALHVNISSNTTIKSVLFAGANTRIQYTGTTETLTVSLNGGGTTVSATVRRGQLQTIIVWYDGATLSVFVNGSLASSAASTNTAATSNRVILGGTAYSSADACAMVLVSHTLWSRALTIEQCNFVSGNYDLAAYGRVVPRWGEVGGDSGITGTFSTTGSPDALTSVGTLAVTGSLATTETPDSVTASGSLSIIGSVAVTETADSATISGQVEISGTMSVTDSPDQVAFSGNGQLVGSLFATDGADTGSMSGVISIIGSVNTSEGPESVSITGALSISGSLAATDSPDQARFVAGDVVMVLASGITLSTETRGAILPAQQNGFVLSSQSSGITM